MSDTASTFLHVANGTSTTESIEASAIPGRTSIWADPLYDGPVPGDISDDELLRVRARFLSGPRHSADDVLYGLRAWRRIIDDHDAYSELVLWFEHDLFDQLALLQLLSWLRGRVPATKAVSLICIGSFPGRPRFKGLGELTPDELASLFDTRQRIADSQYVLAERGWNAFREPTPEKLDALRRADTAALPYLAAAITRFLQEYPWTTDGLTRSERRLLTLAAKPIELASAFPRMHDGEDAYYITDSSLDELANSLSQSSPPLLTRTSHAPTDGSLRDSVAVTEAGREILAGWRDRIATCGIDRWLGGVHLQGRGEMWRWNEQRQGMVRS